MARQIGESSFERRKILLFQRVFVHTPVHLESTDGCDDHGTVRSQSRFAALDVHEFFGAEVRTETGFGDDIVCKLQRALGGNDRVAAVRDICKWAAVNQSWIVLDRLNKIRREGVFQ